VRPDEVPEDGRRIELEADEATRDALAHAAGLDALLSLTARFDLARHGAEGVHVVGTVLARVRQICVVTLDPVESDIEEAVDLLFMPAQARPRDADPAIEAAEGPEPLIGGVVDLGAVATEFLMLGINPYPRKPDAVFTPPAVEKGGGHPFEALAALKKP
jgi:hypothetical protein